MKEKILTSVASSGHVDVLINCAGITHTATMQETPSEKYQVGMYILILVSFEGWRFFELLFSCYRRSLSCCLRVCCGMLV